MSSSFGRSVGANGCVVFAGCYQYKRWTCDWFWRCCTKIVTTQFSATFFAIALACFILIITSWAQYARYPSVVPKITSWTTNTLVAVFTTYVLFVYFARELFFNAIIFVGVVIDKRTWNGKTFWAVFAKLLTCFVVVWYTGTCTIGTWKEKTKKKKEKEEENCGRRKRKKRKKILLLNSYYMYEKSLFCESTINTRLHTRLQLHPSCIQLHVCVHVLTRRTKACLTQEFWIMK